MGGWSFIRPRLEELLSDRQELRYVGRVASASPATGSYTIHQLEQQQIVKEALDLKSRQQVSLQTSAGRGQQED